MKLFSLLMIALVFSFSAAEGNLRKPEGKLPEPDRELGSVHVSETHVTIEREIDGDGHIPKGRAVPFDSNHELSVPPEVKDADDHGRALGKKSSDDYYGCSSCWWDDYYGYISYCCSYEGNSYYCDYYYC